MKRRALILPVWLLAFPAAALSPPTLAVVQPKVTNTVAWTGFSLTTLGALVKAHWDASDLAASPVATWTDDVASIATTAAGSAQPTWEATGFKGPSGLSRPGVICDGVANALVNTSFAALPQGSTAGEIWALVDQQGASGANTLIRYGGIGGGTMRSIQKATARPSLNLSDGNGTTAIVDNNPTYFGPSVVAGTWSGTTQGGFINGVATQPPTTTITTLNTSSTRLRLCAINGTTVSSFFPGVVSDVVVVTTLTTAQRNQLAAWLAWRGGAQSRLDYNNPYRTRQP